MTLSDDCSGSIGLREEFAKQCFETLLEFSLLDTDISNADQQLQETSVTNRLGKIFNKLSQITIFGHKSMLNCTIFYTLCSNCRLVWPKSLTKILEFSERMQKKDQARISSFYINF